MPNVVVARHPVIQRDSSRVLARVAVGTGVAAAADQLFAESLERCAVDARVAEAVGPVGVPVICRRVTRGVSRRRCSRIGVFSLRVAAERFAGVFRNLLLSRPRAWLLR